MTRDRAEWIAVTTLVIIVGLVFFARVPGIALVGFDSYPEILTSRILDFSDFIGTFTEQTSEGFYPSAFYRPLLNLSLAGDYALWGLEPLGYHATAIFLVCACGLSLFWLSRNLLGQKAYLARWMTILVFLLMPVQMEIIPLVSRRMDVLCGLFSALALATQIERIRRPTPVGGFLPALFTAFAVASKEAGVAVVPLIFLLAIGLPTPVSRMADRLLFALRLMSHHLAAVVVVFAIRFAAIGGLGGHPSTDPLAIFVRLPKWLGNTVVQIVSAWPIPHTGIAIGWLHGISVVTLLGLALLCLKLLLQPARSDDAAPSEARLELVAFCLGGMWIVLLASIYAVTGLLQPWYLFLPAMGLALMLGAVAQRLSRNFRTTSGGVRLASLAGLMGIAIWLAMISRFSPLFVGFGHWEAGAQSVGLYLEELTRGIERAPDGGTFEIITPQQMAVGRPSPIMTPFATWINVYSLPAWAELNFPNRSIEFESLAPNEPIPVPRAAALIVVIRDPMLKGHDHGR